MSAALLGISSNLRLPYGSKTTESGEWLIWCMIASAHGASMRRSQLGVHDIQGAGAGGVQAKGAVFGRGVFSAERWREWEVGVRCTPLLANEAREPNVTEKQAQCI